MSDNTFFLCVLLIATSCMADPLFILVLRDLKWPFSLFFPPLIVLFTLGVGSLCGSFFFQFLFHFLGNLLLEISFALSPYIRLLPQADQAMVRVNMHGSLHKIVRTGAGWMVEQEMRSPKALSKKRSPNFKQYL